MCPQISRLASEILTAAGAHLWQTSVILAALFVMAGLMRRAPAALANALLLTGLVKLLIPLPLLGELLARPVGTAVRAVSASPILAGVAGPLLERTVTILDPAGTGLFPGPAETSALGIVTLIAWAAGSTALLVMWFLHPRGSSPDRSVPLPSVKGAVRRQIDSALLGTGIPEEVILVSGSRVMPHVAGLFRPRIVIPETLAISIEEPELRCVLLHEEAHRSRREPLRLALSRLAALVFFFYPLVWPLLRWLRETSEMECDDRAIAAGADPRAYTRALAAVLDMELEAAPASAVLDRDSPSMLRRRLERLSEPRRYTMHARHRAVLLLAVALVLTASALALTSAAREATTDSAAPPPPAKSAPPAPPEVPAPLPEPEEFFIRKMVPPEYPEVPRAEGLEAIVVLKLTLAGDLTVADATPKTVLVGKPPLEVMKIGSEGKVIEPVEEEGMKAYHQAFVDAAVEAALQWELEVRPTDADIVSRELVVPIQFRLEDEGDDKSEETAR